MPWSQNKIDTALAFSLLLNVIYMYLLNIYKQNEIEKQIDLVSLIKTLKSALHIYLKYLI